MKNLKTQIEDWKQIKALSNKVGVSSGENRKSTAQELYEAIRVYYGEYRTKFDYHNQPSEE